MSHSVQGLKQAKSAISAISEEVTKASSAKRISKTEILQLDLFNAFNTISHMYIIEAPKMLKDFSAHIVDIAISFLS